jgi:hypothetical protein
MSKKKKRRKVIVRNTYKQGHRYISHRLDANIP